MLLSPEQLISPSFSTLLTKRAFTSRLCALGVDEMHLVNDWGDPDFREAFRCIGHVLARLPPKTTFIGVTATLLAGIDTSQLISTLGLPPDSYFFQRRSNVRRDMRNIFRILQHGLAGWTFPDLDWIAHSQRKTIVYCETINLGFRLSIYFRQIVLHKRVRRLYNSMCFPSHNIATCQTFVDDPNVGIIIATDAMVVGFDFPMLTTWSYLDVRIPTVMSNAREGLDAQAVMSGTLEASPMSPRPCLLMRRSFSVSKTYPAKLPMKVAYTLEWLLSS